MTFKATKAMPAAEVAKAFANLANTNGGWDDAGNGDYQGAGQLAFGTYHGKLVGWTSAAAEGDTVVFTAAKAGVVSALEAGKGSATDADTIVTKGAAETGATKVTLTPQAGVVDITASGAVALKTISIDGYSASGSSQATGSTKLETLTLKNGGNFTAASADTLALNLDTVNGAVAVNTAKTLNVDLAGKNNGSLSASAATAVTIAGAGSLTATSTTLGAAATLTVKDAAVVDLGAAVVTATTVDTTANTGSVTVAVDDATYKGGAGKDVVTVDASGSGIQVAKEYDLGAGDDKLDLTKVTDIAATAKFEGGEGTDIIKLTAAQTVSGGADLATKLVGFEKLELATQSVSGSVNLDVFKYNHVITNGGSGGLSLSNLANNGTVEIAGKNAWSGGVTTFVAGDVKVGIKGADASATDVLNIIANVSSVRHGDDASKPAAMVTLGTVEAKNVETINITAVNAGVDKAAASGSGQSDVSFNKLTLDVAHAETVNITGAGNFLLDFAASGSKLITKIDASTATGNLELHTSAASTVATTVLGGTGKDTLIAEGNQANTLNGGAGDDTIVDGKGLNTLIGGEGNDLFAVGYLGANAKIAATSMIEDFAVGDTLAFVNQSSKTAAATSFLSQKVAVDQASGLLSAASEALAAAAVLGTDNAAAEAGEAAWFQLGGNTYVVVQQENSSHIVDVAFNEGTDLIIGLTGLVDLSTASFNTTQGTLQLTA